jgi:hypothetical protein
LYATGGFIPAAGFIGLSVAWLFTTTSAYTAIKKRNLRLHQEMMIYSYATCFSAVTLRIYLPLLALYFGNFLTPYSISAWLCWLPNLAVAYLIIKAKRKNGVGDNNRNGTVQISTEKVSSALGTRG